MPIAWHCWLRQAHLWHLQFRLLLSFIIHIFMCQAYQWPQVDDLPFGVPVFDSSLCCSGYCLPHCWGYWRLSYLPYTYCGCSCLEYGWLYWHKHRHIQNSYWWSWGRKIITPESWVFCVFKPKLLVLPIEFSIEFAIVSVFYGFYLFEKAWLFIAFKIGRKIAGYISLHNIGTTCRYI